MSADYESPDTSEVSGKSHPRGHGEQQDAALAQLEALRRALGQISFPLELPGVENTRADVDAAIGQLDDYILPRLRSLDAPLLAVVGGSTGAGKSTLVNALAGHPVTRAGAIRPTTRQPILLHNPADAHWFNTTRVLPNLKRIRGEIINQASPKAPVQEIHAANESLVLVADSAIRQGIALLDAPDVDSISADNRQLAGQLLAAADLWLFVTTANRYADAVPWRLLVNAAERDITVAVVLDRVPPGAEVEVGTDLKGMLDQQGLGDSRLFIVTEQPLDEQGMLPPTSVEPIVAWLAEIAANAGARQEIARRTLNGTLRALSQNVAQIAVAAQAQDDAAASLASDVTAAYQDAGKKIAVAAADGSLLRGEVLSRWQDFVGTGEAFRALETGISRLRDRVGAFFKGQPTPVVKVEAAIESGLQAVILDQCAKAAEDSEQRWRSDPAGRALLGTASLDAISPEFPAQVSAQIRDWQGAVLQLIKEQGASKRSQARWLSVGVNGLGVALMVTVFSFTGGLTGAEIGIAGGTAVVAQKVLEAVFGEDAVRRLTVAAKKDLQARCELLLESQKDRFLALLPAGPGVGEAKELGKFSASLVKLGAAK